MNFKKLYAESNVVRNKNVFMINFYDQEKYGNGYERKNRNHYMEYIKYQLDVIFFNLIKIIE